MRNKRWRQTVDVLKQHGGDVHCFQEATLEFFQYALESKYDTDVPNTKEDVEEAAKVKASAGGLSPEFGYVWFKRGEKFDGCAILFRRSKIGTPLYGGETKDRDSVKASFDIKDVDAKVSSSQFVPIPFTQLKGPKEWRHALLFIAYSQETCKPIGSFLCVHLEGDKALGALRIQQLEEALQVMAKKDCKTPVTVVCGDFNDPHTEHFVELTKKYGLTYVPFKPKGADPTIKGHWSTSNFGAIDHVFISDEGRIVTPVQPWPAIADRPLKAITDVGVGVGEKAGIEESPFAVTPYNGICPSDHLLLSMTINVDDAKPKAATPYTL